MSNLTPQDCLTAFQTRRACCRALLELSQQQATRIAADEFSELTEILNSKQALIEHLDRLSHEQQTLKRAWPSARDGFSATDRQRCETVLAETETLLAALLAEEESSSRQLAARRDDTQRELQSLAAGAQTQDAYAPRTQSVLSRFDVNL